MTPMRAKTASGLSP